MASELETKQQDNVELKVDLNRYKQLKLIFERHWFVGVTSASALLLSYAGITVWEHNDFSIRQGFILPLCCFLGTVGLIWTGCYCRGLFEGLWTILKSLKTGRAPSMRARGNQLTKELTKAISKYIKDNTKQIAELQEAVGDLRIQNQLLQSQKRNTDAIIYGIHDAVIVVDEFDNVLMANEAAGTLFNFDFRNAQLKPLDKLIDSSKSEFVEFLRQSRKGKVQASRREIEFKQSQESKFYDCIISCVLDSSNQISGAVAVLHDITREKEISKMKSDFVSYVSHELKTPLASITAYSEMLYDGEANDEKTRKEFYSIIQNQAQRLNRLIEDILNISRIESGLIKVSKKCLSLTILIEEQLKMIKSYAEEKHITVTGGNQIVFDQVYVDKDMISQVIINLLSNAVKYTPEGGAVRIETDVDDIAHVARVSVIDNGVGIPEKDLEHMFEKFFRVEANKKMAKGTGLGLNLVKQIIEKIHNGRVFVKSKVGEGSTFGFELPLVTSEVLEKV